MIVHDTAKKQLKIVIPVSSVAELGKYQKGLLNLLKRINIEKCDPQFKDDLAAVYELLSHILMEKEFPSQHDDILNDLSSDTC
jgi:hypothetical protein